MAKFYVQCGCSRGIVDSDDPQQAALALVDLLVQPHVWVYEDPSMNPSACRDHLLIEALLHLEPTIKVSERGFDRIDAQLVPTSETMDQWHALMVAASKLLSDAGLVTRDIASVASVGPQTSTSLPRLPR